MASKPALSDLSEQKLFDDLYELQTSAKVSIFKKGKKTFRIALEQQYGLEHKALKKYEPFSIAFKRFKEKMSNERDAESNDEEPEPKQNENEQDEEDKVIDDGATQDKENKKSKKKKKKKDKSKKKKK